MKRIVETIKVVIEEIMRDIDVYLAIQKYSRISKKISRHSETNPQ